MSYTNVYPSRINWENEPSIVSPINATNLNKMDYALYEMDGTLDNWDTTKANQSDLLLCVKSIDYDTTTGVFVFTWQNGTTKTVDLNIEKIPVSFSMDANGVITMTTSDGTQYTADVGSLIKTYSFNDSSEIDFTVTTDASGNKTVTASLVAGSITGDKLEPNYLANCQSAANSASGSATAADGSAEDAEAWAVGQRNGVDVPSTDPAYQNNSKWWANHTSNSLAGLTDVNITNPADGDVLKYDNTNSEWVNGQAAAGGGSTVEVTTSESTLHGQAVTLTDGVTTLSTTFDNTGKATFTGVTLTGNVTISASAGGQTASKSISIPYFGNYSTTLAFFSATIAVTFDASKGATCTLDGVTATTSPHTFTVSAAGTYTASCTLDGVVKQGTAKVITTDGQTETDTIEYGTINLTYANEFRGQSITCTQGGTTITKTAPSAGNSLAFYPPTTGSWDISGTYSGTPYSTSATVSSLSTAVSATLETIPNGSTVTPTDDIQTWLRCAQITGKSYTTLAQVLADSETYNRLLSDSNACDYMKRSTTWASTIVADANAMTTLGKYDYACDTLLSDSTWASAIANSTYFESVLNVKVPTMTSNTTPSGTCIYSSQTSGNEAYRAFDGNDNTAWSSADMTSPWCLGYDFGYDVCVKKIGILDYPTSKRIRTFKVQGYNGSTWEDVSATLSLTGSESGMTYFTISNTGFYSKYQISIATTSGDNPLCSELQFYGRTSNYDSTKITFHGAIGGSLYYLDGGSPTPLATIDTTTKIAQVSKSSVPKGTYAIYDTVAKNPSDLTDDYSKTITITDNTTEVYVVPDNVVYWYGYKSPNYEKGNTANGWSISSRTIVDVTENTADITLDSTYGSTECGFGTKYTVSDTTVHAIVKTTELQSSSGLRIGGNTSKTPAGTYYSQTALNTAEHVTQALTGSNYLFVWSSNGRDGVADALWYE